MNVIEALWMGLLQGLTEYLPVSSSGHLAIASHLFNINGEENLTFTITVHIATVCSTLVILWKEVSWILRGLFDVKDKTMNEARSYTLNIVISMIPIGIVGLFFKDFVEQIFGSGLFIVSICLLITALLLAFSYYARPRLKQDISRWDAFIIGVAQALAVLPGLSRSGATIATGLLLGNKKTQLARFSFLMVIPPILGEALLDIIKLADEGVKSISANISPLALIVGFAAAFLSGCLACKWMINIVKRGRLIWFAIYCGIVGALTLIYNFQ